MHMKVEVATPATFLFSWGGRGDGCLLADSQLGAVLSLL